MVLDKRTRLKRFLDTPIAHRGYHNIANGIPENSLAAFEAAVANGYPIELDVHLLSDGEVVVFHDEDLFRLTGKQGRIFDLTAKMLRDYRLLKTDQPIPLLSEVLSLVAGRTPLLIEIKSDGQVGPLESAIARLLDGYAGDAAIQSFNPSSVQWFADNAPDVLRGQLSGTFKGESMSLFRKAIWRSMILSIRNRPDFFALEVASLDDVPAIAVRAFGVPLLTWTVRNQNTRSAIAGKVDNMIFEGFKA